MSYASFKSNVKINLDKSISINAKSFFLRAHGYNSKLNFWIHIMSNELQLV